jgi:hypothetical protein
MKKRKSHIIGFLLIKEWGTKLALLYVLLFLIMRDCYITGAEERETQKIKNASFLTLFTSFRYHFS